MTRSIAPILFCLLFSLFLVTTPNHLEAEDEDIALGVILPMSGTHAAYGHMQRNSMVMALEEINARGGINGKRLTLDIRDSGGRSRQARSIVDHFVKDKQYSVVLGGFSSRVASALGDKCEQRRIPLIVVTGSEDAITLQEHLYVFRVAPPRSRYPSAALGYAGSKLERENITIVTERSDYGDSMARTVKQASRDAGWKIVGEWSFEIGARNLEKLLADVEAASPDMVFLTAFPPEGSRMAAELKKRIRGCAVFNLVPASVSSGSYAQCGDECSGIMNLSLWQPGATNAGARYMEKYISRFETAPDYHGAQAYAAVIAAAQALARAGTNQAEPVREALAGISVNTPYSRVSFREWGGFFNQNEPPNYLVEWTGTGFEVIWPR